MTDVVITRDGVKRLLHHEGVALNGFEPTQPIAKETVDDGLWGAGIRQYLHGRLLALNLDFRKKFEQAHKFSLAGNTRDLQHLFKMLRGQIYQLFWRGVNRTPNDEIAPRAGTILKVVNPAKPGD